VLAREVVEEARRQVRDVARVRRVVVVLLAERRGRRQHLPAELLEGVPLLGATTSRREPVPEGRLGDGHALRGRLGEELP